MYNTALPATGGVGIGALMFWYPMLGISLIVIGVAVYSLARLISAEKAVL